MANAIKTREDFTEFEEGGLLFFIDREEGDAARFGPYATENERTYELGRHVNYLNTGQAGVPFAELAKPVVPVFNLGQQQREAANLIEKWWKQGEENGFFVYQENLLSGDSDIDFENSRPIFRLFGYAGTGKTTTIRAIIEQLELKMGIDVLFAAFTGKAALVMQRQGLPARTIHSLIYKPVEPNKDKCNELQKKLMSETDPDEKKRIRKDLQEAQKIHFDLRKDEETDLTDAKLLVLDECSMVNDDMLRDLLRFEVPLLVLGDPGQLSPIEGEGALIKVEPDYMLTEIHRQAEGNPIIDMATKARQGIYISKMMWGDSGHLDQARIVDPAFIMKFDQILTGKNATRQDINRNMRHYKGFANQSPYPVVGEKIICLKNNAGSGLFNGMMCEVHSVGDVLDFAIEYKIIREGETNPIEVKILRAHFDAYFDKEALDKVRWWEKADADEFDFGYAITVHKSQGSQWDRVLIWDDGFFVWDKPQRKRWLYTALTRAAKSVVLAGK